MAYEWLNPIVDAFETGGNILNAARPFLDIGGSIYDRNQTQNAINSGFNQYRGYAEDSLNTLGQVYNQGRGAIRPYLQAGNRGLRGYQNLLQNPNQITNDPGYQFRLNQGAEGMRRQLAAGGFRGSGNSAIELTKYGQDYATGEYNNALSRYLPMINTGQNATGQLTDLGRNYAYGVTGINEALGEAATGAAIGNAGANSRMVTDFLGMTGGNPFSQAADALGNVRSAVNGVNELGNLATAGGGNPFAAVGESVRQFGTGNWADPTAGPRTSARMPTGAGATAGATGAGISNTLASWTANGTPVAGSLPYSPVGNFSPTANAAPGAASSIVPANSPLNSATTFLQSAPGMGIVAGVLTGLITKDWGKAVTTGLGTAGGAALGNVVAPGIGGVIGGALGGIAGGMIGPGPSDESSQTTVNFNNGKISNYGGEASVVNRSISSKIIKQVSGWADMVKEAIPGANFKGGFDIIAGSRDGMRVRYYDNGKRTMLNAGTDPQKFAQNVATGFKKSLHGLPSNVVDAISKVNFSNPALARQQLEHINTTIWTPEDRARYRNARRSTR